MKWCCGKSGIADYWRNIPRRLRQLLQSKV